MNLKKLFLMLTFFVLMGTTAFAQVYVRTGGSDFANDGTSMDLGFKSISHAISVAPDGSTIYIQAGNYSAALTGETSAPVNMNVAKTFTFVGVATLGFTTVNIQGGFTITDASATVNMGLTGIPFNLGENNLGSALVLAAGSMNISSSNVVIMNGGTITFTAGTLNNAPTVSNANVIFNGTSAVGSTSSFLPSSLGSGTLTFNQASGDVTVDNASLSLGNVVLSNAANGNITGNLTVAANGDITTSSTGTLTIGQNGANVLTMSSTSAGLGQITVSGGSSVVVNASVNYSVKNAGSGGAGDSAPYVAGNVFEITGGASYITVNGNITFNNTNVASNDGKNAIPNTVTISNASTKDLTINGNITTPLSGTSFSAPTGGNNNSYIQVILSNTAAGNFSVRNAALRGATGTNGVINNNGGTMTIGQIGDTFTTGWDVVNDNTNSKLVVNASSNFSSNFNNNATTAGALVTFNTNATIGGLFTNAANVDVKSNTITLSRGTTAAGAAVNALANTGDIYSGTTATVGQGAILLSGRASTISGVGNLPNIEIAGTNSTAPAYPALTNAATIYGYLKVTGGGTLNVNGATVVKGAVNMTSGSITLGANLTVEGLFEMPQGTFSFVTFTLTLKGDFNRTGGTIDATAAGSGKLIFAGASPQTFNPGVQMVVYDVEINNTGTYLVNVIANDVVTQNGTLDVLHNYTITTGQLQLGGTSFINMDQVTVGGGTHSARFDISSATSRGYTAVGTSGIVFAGDGVIGAVGTGAVLVGGATSFGNVYVRLTTAANNVHCLGAVKLAGSTYLQSGGIIWNEATVGADAFTNSTLTLYQAAATDPYPFVVISTTNTNALPYLEDGADGIAVPLAVSSRYNLTYQGNAVAPTVAASDVTGPINNFSDETSGGQTLTLNAAPIAVLGNLNVNATETFNLNAQTLTASGNTASHTVNGTVTNGTVSITGKGATLTGGVGTGNTSKITVLSVAPLAAGTFTSTGMKELTALTINQADLVSSITMNSASATVNNFTNTAGSTTLNMNSTAVSATGTYTVTAGNVTLTMNDGAAGTSTIGTNLAINGGSLTLGSSITVAADVSQANAGSLALADKNLTIVGDYSHAGTGTITGTGYIIATPGGAQTYTFTSTATIPNLRINGGANSVTLAANGLTVSNAFRMSAGTFGLTTLPLNITGNTIRYDGGTITATGAAGKISLKGSAPIFTAYANVSIPYLEVNTSGSASFMTDDPGTPAPRNFTVTGAFTHTKGDIALNINDLVLTNGAANASYTTAATAGSVTGATGSDLGEVVFSGAVVAAQNLTLAADYSIQNMRITNANGVTKTDTKVLTVTDNFGLNGGSFAFANTARLVLGNGATITRSAGVFDNVPTWGTSVNVVYNGALNTDLELPTSTTLLNNLTINGAVVFKADATVNGTLFLTGGSVDLTTNSKALTIVPGGTINRSGGGWLAATDKPTVSTYKLVYSGTAALTDGNEFVSTAGAITSLTISMTNGGLNLTNSRTIGDLFMSPTGNSASSVYLAIGADNAVKTLTVTGTATINNGRLTTKDAAASNTTAGNLDVKGSLLSNGGTIGYFGTDSGTSDFDGGLNLAFSGAVAQDLTLSGNQTIQNITLNSTGTTAANSTINVTGGDLTVSSIVFTNGILKIDSTHVLIMPRPQGAAYNGLAFDRSSVIAHPGTFGHVVGKIRRQVKLGDGAVSPLLGPQDGRFVFPVGDISGNYRPFTVSFTPTYPSNVNTDIEVNMISASPAGTAVLDLDNGAGTRIGGIPNFYWLVNTRQGGYSATQRFDVDEQTDNASLSAVHYNPADYSKLRIIRREASSNNPWVMQGDAINYANYQSGSDVVVRTTSSQGGLVETGTIFTIGVPAVVPQYLSQPSTFTVAEGATTNNTVQITATPQNSGETITSYTKISGPAFANVSSSGLVTLTPGYSDFSATPYPVIIRATSNTNLTADWTLNVTVTNTDRAASFTATGASVPTSPQTVATGATLSLQYTAIDADGDAITYSLASSPAPSVAPTLSATGALTFAPEFADGGKTFTFIVTASSGTPALTVSDTTVVNVTYGVAVGDVNGDGSITAADATPILQYVVGLITLTPQQLYAANVNNDASVGSLDAAWILYYSVNGTWPTLAKSAAVAGNVNFGQLNNDNGTLSVPISLKNTSGVISMYAEVNLGNQLEFKGVKANLPEGWQVVSNLQNGVLKIAMAGLKPLTDGNLALIQVSLNNKEAVAAVDGSVKMNDAVYATMQQVNVREIPNEFSLSQNYPNPFNPTTNIKYAISQDSRVSLVIYNILGQVVRTLVDQEQQAGYYNMQWDGNNNYGSKVASGIYIYRIQAGNFSKTIKMNLIK